MVINFHISKTIYISRNVLNKQRMNNLHYQKQTMSNFFNVISLINFIILFYKLKSTCFMITYLLTHFIPLFCLWYIVGKSATWVCIFEFDRLTLNPQVTFKNLKPIQQMVLWNLRRDHCVKSVCIWSYSGS